MRLSAVVVFSETHSILGCKNYESYWYEIIPEKL